jgi:hypothetical protein
MGRFTIGRDPLTLTGIAGLMQGPKLAAVPKSAAQATLKLPLLQPVPGVNEVMRIRFQPAASAHVKFPVRLTDQPVPRAVYDGKSVR